MNKNHALNISVLLPLISVMVTHPYIDPGTGSIVVQVLIGSIAAILVSIGMFWKQVRAIISSLLSRIKKE